MDPKGAQVDPRSAQVDPGVLKWTPGVLKWSPELANKTANPKLGKRQTKSGLAPAPHSLPPPTLYDPGPRLSNAVQMLPDASRRAFAEEPCSLILIDCS